MKPFLVGVTGTICGGKSTFMETLKSKGLYTIKADDVAKELLYTNENKLWLTTLMGDSIITNSGIYDFSEIRRIMFSQPQVLHAINGYTSRHVWEEIHKRVTASKSLVIFVENALLFESDWKNNFNLTLCIYCSEKESVRRLYASRGVRSDIAGEIISNQLPMSRKIAQADFAIDTTSFQRHEKHRSLESFLQILHERYPYMFP